MVVMGGRDHSCPDCGGGGLDSPPAPDCSCHSQDPESGTSMERVEAALWSVPDGMTRGHIDMIPAPLAREIAARLDDPQRQEDEEAGRLMREPWFVQLTRLDDEGIWRAVGLGSDLYTRFEDGPTPAAALRKLQDAIGGEG